MSNPNPLQRGRHPNQNKQSKKQIDNPRSGGNQNYGGQGGHGSRRHRERNADSMPPEEQPPETLPWLIAPGTRPEFDPGSHVAPSASFVEYLRWMRSPDHAYKDSTKLQIMQLAVSQADYEDRLKALTERTEKIASARNGITFCVEAPWRLRVGGLRGPESILLPAFDATGMPYIPSSALRGIARNQAMREQLPPDFDVSDTDAAKRAWEEADKKVAKYFGHLEADKSERVGKVIFLDAYPLPSKTGGLVMDMVNNIWNKEDNNELPKYDPNPNLLFSLKTVHFKIGLCPRINIEAHKDAFEQVKRWLIKGLESGVGSQVNSGYGTLLSSESDYDPPKGFLEVKFNLKGQLILGQQAYRKLSKPYKPQKKDNKYIASTWPIPEVRPIAFKSMLRYWFRAFSAGFLPVADVQGILEPKLFGSIQPQKRGWVKFQITDTEESTDERGDLALIQEKGKPCLEQSGTLRLSYSTEAPKSQEQRDCVKSLFEHLMWLMFHLGGIGQGARRPLYSRNRTPYYRGSDLRAEQDNLFEPLPDSIVEFEARFKEHIRSFRRALGELSRELGFTCPAELSNSLSVKNIQSNHEWAEAVDSLCRIIVIKAINSSGKPESLAHLHQLFHEFEDQDNIYDAKNLGGHVTKDDCPPLAPKDSKRPITKADRAKQKERKATPSPIWISNLRGKNACYQVITIFGYSQSPRKEFWDTLWDGTTIRAENKALLWPFSQENDE